MSIKSISPQDVNELLNQGKELYIIDVRENDEVTQGMIPGAKHIPLGEIPSRINEFDKSKEYILVCRSGKRSEKACTILVDNQVQVINMTGGMLSWDGKTK